MVSNIRILSVDYSVNPEIFEGSVEFEYCGVRLKGFVCQDEFAIGSNYDVDLFFTCSEMSIAVVDSLPSITPVGVWGANVVGDVVSVAPVILNVDGAVVEIELDVDDSFAGKRVLVASDRVDVIRIYP